MKVDGLVGANKRQGWDAGFLPQFIHRLTGSRRVDIQITDQYKRNRREKLIHI